MAFVFTVEDGTGLAAANSYVSVAEANDYFTGRLYASAWTAAATTDKEKALVLASLVIDAQVRFNGGRLNQSQGLQWPRVNCPDPDWKENTNSSSDENGFMPSNEVPKLIRQATCEMGKELLTADRTLTENEGINQISLPGAFHVQFQAKDRRPLLSRLVISMVSRYGQVISASTSVAKLIRT